MDAEEFKRRTKQFALEILRLARALPAGPVTNTLGRQLVKSGTSVGANYRAACRARSRAEFVAKMGIVEEEADETLYWMELLAEADIISREQVEELAREASEILAMTIASIRTVRNARN